MADCGSSPSKTTHVGEKVIDVEITVRVTGRARIYVDRDGFKHMKRAEIDYCEEKIRKDIDNDLLPLLEKAVGFKHVVLEGEKVASGCAMVGLRCMLYEDAPLLRECIERDKKKRSKDGKDKS